MFSIGEYSFNALTVLFKKLIIKTQNVIFSFLQMRKLKHIET